MVKACAHGHVEVAQWLHATFVMTREDVLVDNCYAVSIACDEGHLSVLQWLHTTFEITPAEVRANNNCVLLDACIHGHLEVAQWLHTLRLILHRSTHEHLTTTRFVTHAEKAT